MSALSQNDIRLINEALKPALSRNGYQRREMTWYSYTQSLTRVFDFQPGITSCKARFNLGLGLRGMDSSTHPRIFDCAVYGRLDKIAHDTTQYELATDFSNSALTSEDRATKIVELVEGVALPFLKSIEAVKDLSAFIRSSKSQGFMIKESAKQLLQSNHK